MSGKGGVPKGDLAKVIAAEFGSYGKFKAQLEHYDAARARGEYDEVDHP